MSAINDRYLAVGGTDSFLGQSLSEEGTCSDGFGGFRQYEWGSIYWHPYTGAHEIHGDIYSFWANNGCEKGPLGYPISDELSTPEGGRFSIFERGVIHQKPNSQANMATIDHIPQATVLQAITMEVDKIIEEKNLFRVGEAVMNRVYEWYDWAGTYYHRAVQVDFEMEAEVKATGTVSPVDLELYFACEASQGSVVATLIREHHFVIPKRSSSRSSGWRRHRGYRQSFRFRDVGAAFSRALDDTVDGLVHRELIWQLSEAVGKSGQIPIGPNLLAAHPLDDGSVRLYLSD